LGKLNLFLQLIRQMDSAHPHSFRLGRLTQLRDHCADIFTLQALANHRQIETTKRYLKGVEEGVREAVRSLDF
jgi:site-specific recombinase XerD